MAAFPRYRLPGVLVCFALLVAGPQPAHAAAVVTTCSEQGLTAAIAAGSPVTFACDGIITLTHTITVSGVLEIDGSGHTVTISGGPGDSEEGVGLFVVPANASLTLKNLALINGYVVGTTTTVSGGAVNNSGVFTALRVRFENNEVEAVNTLTRGGAVFNNTGAQANLTESFFLLNKAAGRVSEGAAVSNLGTLFVDRCTFERNSVRTLSPANNNGGGITNHGTLTVLNSTFYNNLATTSGGAIYNDGTALVSSSTFNDNDIYTGSGNTFLSAGEGTLTVRNSIIDGPISTSIACHTSGNGVILDGGGNLVWRAVVCDQIFGAQVPPGLGPYGQHGGYTPTFSLLANSAAINRAQANCPAVDQRGVARSPAPCDSGSYEFGASTLPTLTEEVYLPLTLCEQ